MRSLKLLFNFSTEIQIVSTEFPLSEEEQMDKKLFLAFVYDFEQIGNHVYSQNYFMQGCSIGKPIILRQLNDESDSLLNGWCTGGGITLKSYNYGGTRPVYL